MYKAVIFDFFGVFCPDITLQWFKRAVPNYESKLADFHAICSKSDYGTLNKADFYSEIAQLTGFDTDEIIAGVESEVCIDNKLVAYVENIRQEGYKTACLSNGTREWTLEIIEKHGLARLFDEIVLSGNLGIIKPDMRIYQHTLTQLQVSASESLFVDDRMVNVDAASKLGIKGIVFTDTETFIDQFQALNGLAN